MPVALQRFSVFSTALSLLLAGGRKAHSLRDINVPQRQSFRLPTIADAMLARAVEKGQLPASRIEKPVSFQGSNTSTPTIDGLFRGSQNSANKSIGGFTRLTNASNLQAKSTTAQKRPSSEMHGFAAMLGKPDSFQEAPNAIDLTKEVDKQSKQVLKSQLQFDFDPNDFDDDSEIDLDTEYPQPLPPMSAPRRPLQTVSANSPHHSPFVSTVKNTTPPMTAPQSSAQTWSSSPLAHKLTPPGVANRRQPEDLEDSHAPPITNLLFDNSFDDNPQPAKKPRTLPWEPRQAEQRQRQEAPTGVQCLKCGDHGHLRADCKGLGARCSTCGKYGHIKAGCGGFSSLNPTGKSKTPGATHLSSMPWNTTPGAMKQRQKTFKQQKKPVKDDMPFMEETQDAAKPAGSSRIPAVFLSDEQMKVLDLVINKNQSVFFTGSAGTGKSVLMRAIIADLRKIYAKEPDRIAVTASTGLAACNIGGVTLHSFGGIGLGKEAVPELVRKIKRNKKAKDRWIRAKVLIIDEISMVDGDLFDKLEGIARTIRNNGRPFGGIQLVITGDFFQLPPVPDYGQKRQVKFAFDAGTWSTAINHTIGLTKVFRQKDPVFANMLNEMRLGKITDETVKAFRRLERPVENSDNLEATELFPTRNEVENANSYKMRSLHGKSYAFKAVDTGTEPDLARRDKLLANCMAPAMIELKKGAQVMLIKNLDNGLVNGSLGKVIAFMNHQTFVIYDENPKLLDHSRAEEEMDSSISKEARDKLKSFKMNRELAGDTGKQFPLVRFSMADGTFRDLLCQPEDWKIELPNGEVQAQRSQLPLILSWALSIHKAQGQTLERVTVDLRRAFENGQAYVALSRATCQEGLQVKNFNKKAVMAHPRVITFYESLYNVNAALKHPKVAKAQAANKMKESELDFMLEEIGDADESFDYDGEEAMALYM